MHNNNLKQSSKKLHITSLFFAQLKNFSNLSTLLFKAPLTISSNTKPNSFGSDYAQIRPCSVFDAMIASKKAP